MEQKSPPKEEEDGRAAETARRRRGRRDRGREEEEGGKVVDSACVGASVVEREGENDDGDGQDEEEEGERASRLLSTSDSDCPLFPPPPTSTSSPPAPPPSLPGLLPLLPLRGGASSARDSGEEVGYTRLSEEGNGGGPGCSCDGVGGDGGADLMPTSCTCRNCDTANATAAASSPAANRGGKAKVRRKKEGVKP